MTLEAKTLLRSAEILEWITEGRSVQHHFKLFDDVGQIYEAELARLEFLPFRDDLDTFRRRTAYFEEVEHVKSNHFYISSVLGKGQIGHTSQYSVHWFYPYKGKFHGQMIKSLINASGAVEGDLVLDPFVGSGTTLVEASMLGVKSLGIDINPACCFISRVKADSMSVRAEDVAEVVDTFGVHRVFEYFQSGKLRSQHVLSREDFRTEVGGLLSQLLDESLGDSLGIRDEVRNLLFVCYLHALSDSVYLKGTQKARTHFEFFIRDIAEYLETLRGTNSVQRKLNLAWGEADVKLGSAMELPLPDNSVKAIVTSPPYSIAIDYVKNDMHLLDYLGINPSALRRDMVGLKGRGEAKVRMYGDDVKESLREMLRVLTLSGLAAIVLGDVVVDGQRTKFYKLIEEWAREIGFSDTLLIRRPILGGYARLRYEYIILLQK